MKNLKKTLKSAVFIMVIFTIFYAVLYVASVITPKINIRSANNIYMYDKDGKSFYEGNNGNRKWVKLENISKYLIDATIYSEDKNFYSHNGFDIPRIVMSSLINIKNRDLKQGASTITQQYARNLFLTFEKTWNRKIKEAWYAFKLENTYSKDEILEGYLNTINYGNGIMGVENASYYYFNKPAKNLTLEEASMLAGIPKSPNNYSPLVDENSAKKRQIEVLKAMHKNKIITNEEYNRAVGKTLTYYGKKDNLNLNTIMYVHDAVLDELEELNIVDSKKIRTKGIKIYTTIDVSAQEIAEKAVADNLENKKEMQAALIMMDPKNGSILSLIGGKNYFESEYNRSINSKRQVGSTMKPILYYSALENGLTPASTFLSKKTTFKLDNKNTYSPNNYGGIYPNDNITMALAIAYSDNIYAVKTHLFLGEENLIDTGRKLGITSSLKKTASLPLGTSEISLKEFVSAYSVIANTGYSVKGHLINKIETTDGKILYKYKDENEKILDSSYTYILNEMLSLTYDSSLVSYTTPTLLSIKPKLTKKYAVKSGTTDYDLVTIGYNPDVIVGVWTGYDDNRKLGKKELKYSKNIWADTIEDYLRDKKESWYDMPNNVVGVITDLNTGKVANKNSKLKAILYYVKGTEPK